MIEQNTMYIFNDLIYDLYSCNSLDEIKNTFLDKLRMLIPYSYASIIPSDESIPPLCIPASFIDAELNYRLHSDEDPIKWLTTGTEPTVIRESDLWPDETRLGSELYKHCYRKYNVYNSMQYSIVYNQTSLAILTLYRTRSDGDFTQDDMFYLRTLGKHLNRFVHNLLNRKENPDSANSLEELANNITESYRLTSREHQILCLILSHMNNFEIAAELKIAENTLHKHIQNIYKKTGAASRNDLFKSLPSH